MKAKIWFGFFICVFLLTGFSAFAQTAEDIKKHPNCKYCGMDREKFNYSRMLTTYGDDSEFASCSLHCAAIDLAVSSDDLFLLHTDGHLSTCKFSRLSEVPTRCQDPAPRVDNNPAHRDIDIFKLAHFTQMSITNPPNSVILLLDSQNQSVFRFSPRSFELQNQVSGYAGKGNPFQSESVGAMAVSPNYVLYLAIGDQVYFATNLP